MTMAVQPDLLEEVPTLPLRIERVIPPEPHYGRGTYEVRLELSRPMTCFEVRALQATRRGLMPVNRVLTISDTTLERVQAESCRLSALVHEAEAEGARLQERVRRKARAEAAAEEAERARLAALAERIRFP
jgi:hypothetical protein